MATLSDTENKPTHNMEEYDAIQNFVNGNDTTTDEIDNEKEPFAEWDNLKKKWGNQYKLMLIGDESVGKTSIINRLL